MTLLLTSATKLLAIFGRKIGDLTPVPSSFDFAGLVRRLRQAKGLTQAEFARELEVTGGVERLGGGAASASEISAEVLTSDSRSLGNRAAPSGSTGV